MSSASSQSDTSAQSEFDPYHKWLAISPREQPPNHYRLLAVDLFETDPDVIEAAAVARSTFVRQCATGPHAEASQQVLNDLSTAQICLLNPDSKAAYDAKLKAELAAAAQQAGSSSNTVSTGQRAVDPKVAQLAQKLDKQKKQIEALLKKCEFATAISALKKMAAVKQPQAAKYVKWAKQQLPKAKSGTENMRESTAAMFRTATELVDRNDYEEAAEILQQIPQKYRSREIGVLLQECLDIQEEVAALQEDIERAESLKIFDGLQPTVERLLEIKPNDRRAKKLLKELKTYGKGGGMRLGSRGDKRFDAAGNTSNPLKVALFVIIPLMLFAAVGYATVVYVRSNGKTIKIEIDDPSAKVTIDGEAVEITGVGDTVKLKTGKHDLIVERGDLVVHTREFEVVKGKNQVLRITLEEMAATPAAPAGSPSSPTATATPPATTTPNLGKFALVRMPGVKPQSVKPGMPSWDPKHPFTTIPEVVSTGFQYLNGGNVNGNTSQFDVLSDGIVYLVLSERPGGGGNSSGGWKEKIISPPKLAAAGWTPVGKIGIKELAQLTIYERFCKKGESFTYSWEKYIAPALIVPTGSFKPSSLPVGKDTYLAQLQPTDVKIIGGFLASPDNPVKVNGVDSPHGFHLHPQGNGRGSATFGLSRKYQRISGAFGVRDDLKTGSGTTTTPVTFKILGDGKVLYTSPPLQKWGSTADFNVDVSQVNVLQMTSETEDGYRAWVACVEPRLHVGGSPTDVSPSQPPPVSLVAHYPLDRVKDRKFEDTSGGNHHGAVRGNVRSVKGQIGTAVFVSGKSHVDLGDIANFDWSDAFSLGAWVQRPENGHMSILLRFAPELGNRGYDLMVFEGRPLVHLVHRHPRESIRVLGRQALSPGRWQHVMMTYDGSGKAAGLKIYLDGELQQNDVSVDGLRQRTIKTDKPLVIGHSDPGNEVREGKIDDVQIYRGVLSAAQVKQAMTGPIDTSSVAAPATAKQKVLNGHENDVNDIAISPDGRLIASGGADTLVKLWDSTTGDELVTLRGHQNQVVCVAFSPDGQHVVSGGDGIRIWDTKTGKEVRLLVGHTNVVTDVNFSPDGKQLFSSSVDHTIKVWNVSTGKEIRTLQGHEVHACSVACSPDGQQIVSSAMDSTIKLWDPESGRETGLLKGHTNRVNNVAFSPDGKTIASASYDWTVKLWDAATGKEIRTLKGHRGAVPIIAFTPDGQQIVSGSEDKTLKLWDVATGRELRTFHGHTGGVFGAAFSSNGKQIVSGSRDKTVRIWDVSAVTAQAANPSTGTPSIAPKPVSTRQVAEWVLGLGGTVSTNTGTFKTVDELPQQPFDISHVVLSHKQVTNDGLANLRGLKNLTDLRLQNTPISDAGVTHLKGLTKLITLTLGGTQISDAGLANLQGMTDLVTLHLDSTPIRGEGLKHLQGIAGLAALRLERTQVNDSSLAYLKDMTSLTDLRLGYTPISDAGLVHLKGLTNLTTLTLDETQISDAGLANLQDMTKLLTLHVVSTPLRGEGLKYLQRMAGLAAFRLERTQVDDSSLVHLKGMTSLTDLRLAHSRISDAGLVHLKGLTNLKTLNIEGTQVSDAGLVNLRTMKKLISLHAVNTPIRGEGLKHLQGIAGLAALRLEGTQVDDVGLTHLKKVTSLVDLRLAHTKVTANGVADLQTSLPKCKITH